MWQLDSQPLCFATLSGSNLLNACLMLAIFQGVAGESRKYGSGAYRCGRRVKGFSSNRVIDESFELWNSCQPADPFTKSLMWSKGSQL